MIKYQVLLAAKQSGLMKILSMDFGFPTHYNKWLKIYFFHLEHNKLSQESVALEMGVPQSVVSKVYSFMQQEFMDDEMFLSVVADCINRIFSVISQSNSRTRLTPAILLNLYGRDIGTSYP